VYIVVAATEGSRTLQVRRAGRGWCELYGSYCTCLYVYKMDNRPERKNASGLCAPAGFCSRKTANSTMRVIVERCSSRPQTRKQLQFIL
jgi:hypothetical protein